MQLIKKKEETHVIVKNTYKSVSDHKYKFLFLFFLFLIWDKREATNIFTNWKVD